jgi:hypothetical protein
MLTARAETWTISEAQRLALDRQIRTAFDRIPLAPYETVRKADVRFAVLPSALVPAGDLVRVTVARFDETKPAILFVGPIIIQHSAEVIEVVAAHEWAHAYLWCRREPWTDEHLTDTLIDSWGFDSRLLEDVRFHGRDNDFLRRFLRV